MTCQKRKNIMDVNFEYYKIFYYVAKYHNFTKAAQALNNSQPNITRAMNWIDFAVVSTPAEVDSPLKQIMLMPFQEILVGGTTFTALGSQELSLREVKNYPMISLGRETMTYKFYNSVFLSHGLDLSPDTEAATADQILPLVKCELGLAFLPQPMAVPVSYTHLDVYKRQVYALSNPRKLVRIAIRISTPVTCSNRIPSAAPVALPPSAVTHPSPIKCTP